MFVNNWTIFQTHWNQFTNPAMGVVCFLFCVFLFSFCVFSLVFRGLPVFCLYLFLLRFLRSLSIWYTKIPPKSSKNRPEIESRSLQNLLKSTQNRARRLQERFWEPSQLQVYKNWSKKWPKTRFWSQNWSQMNSQIMLFGSKIQCNIVGKNLLKFSQEF